MTFRRVLTASLLLFVAASVVTLVGKELGGKPVPGAPPAAASKGASGQGRQVVAYYFVGKVRCSSCRKIEEVSRGTIEASYARELTDGRLRFLVVNVDRPENRHFVEEFQLDGSSLVLVEMRDGRPAAWKNLRDVWRLAEDGRQLEKYVRREIAAGLEGI